MTAGGTTPTSPRTPAQAATANSPPAVADTGPARTLVHVMEIPVRWGDMDAFAHVNNAVYLRYAETVRIDWMDAIGLGVLNEGHGTMIVNANVNFRRQLTYPATVLARHHLGAIGRTSFETFTEMARADEPDVVVADCTCRMVWVHLATGRPVPLDDAQRALLRRPLPTVAVR